MGTASTKKFIKNNAGTLTEEAALTTSAGAGGAIVQSLPPGAVFAQVLGYALSATRIHIDVQPPIAIV